VDPQEATPNHSGTLGTPQTPSTQSSDEGPVRFRSLTELLDETEEIHDFEYSGVWKKPLNKNAGKGLCKKK
jgi:hypothetical protein